MLAFVVTVCVGLIGSAPAQAAPPEPSALSGTVTGTLQDGTGKVAGLLNVTKFKKQDGELVAVGKFIGTDHRCGRHRDHGQQEDRHALGYRAGRRRGQAVCCGEAGRSRQQPLIGDRGATCACCGRRQPRALSCQILDLVLGPLDLDLLGLKVHLDTVHLNITAQGGPGNLLGNLLCAVAGLLDGSTGLNGILNGIVTLLNQLLAVLG